MVTYYTTQNTWKRWILSAVIITAVLFPTLPVRAQDARSYVYESVIADIMVRPDASINVSERLSYRFVGEYHKGFRSVSLRKIGTIDEIEVLDGESNIPYVESSKALSKDDPASWGKFYHNRASGFENIEWYYDANNETRSWIIRYRAHGAVTFLKEKDELYWNVFTDYDVPVERAEATITIPGNFDEGLLSATVYVYPPATGAYEIVGGSSAHFSGSNFGPQTPFTIAFGWPKGVVTKSAFWKDWVSAHRSIFLMLGIILLTFLVGFGYHLRTNTFRKGKRTIIAQYDPPRNLRPAMAEVIVKEAVSPKGWAATVVDLAVRGYVKISEDPPTKSEKIFLLVGKILGLILVSVAMFLIGGTFYMFAAGNVVSVGIIAVVFILITIRIIITSKGVSLGRKDYIIAQAKKYEGDPDLEAYEEKFLDALLVGATFSTKELRRNQTKSRALYMKMKALESALYKETELDTNAYEKPVSKEKIKVIGLTLVIFVGAMFIAYGLNEPSAISGYAAVIGVIALCAFGLFIYIKYEAKLNAEGEILKEEWLGFKLYLEKAERFRLQNLTPELFEKYLPYAIIFGVEKQWGKAFESISLPPPRWYQDTSIVYGAGGISNGGFSAGSFSSSFSSSFVSAFSSSGGGGASGGGGGGGGGAGGGGGGAS